MDPTDFSNFPPNQEPTEEPPDFYFEILAAVRQAYRLSSERNNCPIVFVIVPQTDQVPQDDAGDVLPF
jgi:hypothetical protein